MMCWSYQESISFAITESILISFIFIRAIHSKNKHVRQQLYIMPMMCSVCGERGYMLSSSSSSSSSSLLLHCSQLSYAIMVYLYHHSHWNPRGNTLVATTRSSSSRELNSTNLLPPKQMPHSHSVAIHHLLAAVFRHLCMQERRTAPELDASRSSWEAEFTIWNEHDSIVPVYNYLCKDGTATNISG